MKGKIDFTQDEVDQILFFIEEKLISDSSKQKVLRNKIRNLGFYASDFNLRNGYTKVDFLNAVNIIDIKNHKTNSFIAAIKIKESTVTDSSKKTIKKDEHYIVDLCDEILQEKALRQHCFDFLKGDTGRRLPVDAYYPSLRLVIEYRELQHTSSVPFFDKRQTVSGVGRNEQRKIYDQRRRDMLLIHEISLIEINYYEFEHSNSKRLTRNKSNDIKVLKSKFNK